MKQRLGNQGSRVAFVAGVRTPFARVGTAYRDRSAQDLGVSVVEELLRRTELAPEAVDQLVYGQVIPAVSAPNIAREVVLRSRLSPRVEAYSVSRACATSYQSAVNVAEAIALGTAEVGIAGGAESASDVPITVSKRLQRALLRANQAKRSPDKLRAFLGLHPRDLLPQPPALVEPSTGETMGESAEKMAKANGISRAAQDDYAHRSHVRAAAAWAEGKFRDEVMTLEGADGEIAEDNLVRRASERSAYDRLRPVFDREQGSVTAGNASPLTDGASAVLMMREDRAKAEGREILGYLVSYAFAGLDPSWQLLMGPSFASPLALDRAGMTLADMELVDMHEAFAAQILSNTQAFESKRFAEEHLGRSEPIGNVDWERFNVLGGSISVGHPFAATGVRQIVQTLRELRRRGGGHALCTACAAGGLGAAVVLSSD